ncbi:MAG: HAMP domain-containing histidine kinase [Candidatus Pacebacteria bacterium]|nr:HAMP domain-containing histidine kinase [Candidatus Paceibacterota bacterium]
MQEFLTTLKNLIIIIIFIFLSLLNFFQNETSIFYDLPIYFVPFLNFIFGLLVIILYTTKSIAKEKTEEEFTGVVNHTFRTPLTSVMWMTKELEEDLSKEERNNILQKISNSTKKVLDIVDLFVGIKELNNRASYDFKATSVRDIIEKSITKYREDIKKKNINFQISTFKDIPLITLDLNKISFVVDAVLENALLYTKEKGNIEIDATFDKKVLTIIIKDDGIGFDNFEKMKIFNKFYRSKEAILMNPNGMGLKLYLSKAIIKRHKGEIYLESNGKDKGITAYIKLPLAKK